MAPEGNALIHKSEIVKAFESLGHFLLFTVFVSFNVFFVIFCWYPFYLN